MLNNSLTSTNLFILNFIVQIVQHLSALRQRFSDWFLQVAFGCIPSEQVNRRLEPLGL